MLIGKVGPFEKKLFQKPVSNEAKVVQAVNMYALIVSYFTLDLGIWFSPFISTDNEAKHISH